MDGNSVFITHVSNLQQRYANTPKILWTLG